MGDREILELLYEKVLTMELGELFTLVLNRPANIRESDSLKNELEIYVKNGMDFKADIDRDSVMGRVSISIKSEMVNWRDLVIIVPPKTVVIT